MKRKGGEQMVGFFRRGRPALVDAVMDPVRYGYCPNCGEWIRQAPGWACPNCRWSGDR